MTCICLIVVFFSILWHTITRMNQMPKITHHNFLNFGEHSDINVEILCE